MPSFDNHHFVLNIICKNVVFFFYQYAGFINLACFWEIVRYTFKGIYLNSINSTGVYTVIKLINYFN